MNFHYDIVIFGGGIAGLYTANRLRRAGYNLILIEKDTLGGAQTLASQGMIHGGQKYGLGGTVTGHSQSMAEMPARWDACFADNGKGDVDLSRVKIMSNTQLMFPAASLISVAMVHAAVNTANRPSKKLSREQIPDVLTREPVFEMHEQVLETKSLVIALAENLRGRIFCGELTAISADGELTVSDFNLRAQAAIFTAGAGNENVFTQLGVKGIHTQRRPLRQIMVKPMPQAIFGHGTSGGIKPRVTITSHPVGENEYVWYLGGNVAEVGAGLSETDALAFAKKEMAEIFPGINWDHKLWATFAIDRAEPFDEGGKLPAGAYVRSHGNCLISWPTKMTLVPDLSDKILDWVVKRKLVPSPETAKPSLPVAEIGRYPWESVAWRL